VDRTMPGCLKEPLNIPDLTAVEASLDRSRLLLQSGTDVAAMALDAANSIQAVNSLERMLAHQLAAAHKLVIKQMGQVCYEQNARYQTKRLNAAARCMAVYQQGLLALPQHSAERSATYHGAIRQSQQRAKRSSGILREALPPVWSPNLLYRACDVEVNPA
jgi:hypothetical protein